MPMVTLVLAAGPGFPSGSESHRYEIEATLDAQGQFDARAWHEDPRPWPVRRFRPGAEPRTGDLQHDGETGWSLRFDSTAAARELTEPLLGAGALRPGEYLTLRGEDGRDYSYRVVSLG